MWLAWHVLLPWLARLALPPEFRAQVQQGWFPDGRRTKRSLSRQWLEARQHTVLGLLRGKSGVVPTHGPAVMGQSPVRKGSAPVIKIMLSSFSTTCTLPKYPVLLQQ